MRRIPGKVSEGIAGENSGEFSGGILAVIPGAITRLISGRITEQSTRNFFRNDEMNPGKKTHGIIPGEISKKKNREPPRESLKESYE